MPVLGERARTEWPERRRLKFPKTPLRAPVPSRTGPVGVGSGSGRDGTQHLRCFMQPLRGSGRVWSGRVGYGTGVGSRPQSRRTMELGEISNVSFRGNPHVPSPQETALAPPGPPRKAEIRPGQPSTTQSPEHPITSRSATIRQGKTETRLLWGGGALGEHARACVPTPSPHPPPSHNPRQVVGPMRRRGMKNEDEDCSP